MPPLESVRRAFPFDPRVLERSPLFWPVQQAGGWMATYDDFPPVTALSQVFFRGPAPVAFVESRKPRRSSREPPDPARMYDGRITLDGIVPTRPRSWHDLMNALVWGAFPCSKRALHARQHRALVARVPRGAPRLPATRSRELDALALVDEGGIVLLAADPPYVEASLRAGRAGTLAELRAGGQVEGVVFGHAIYESLALGVPPAVAAAVVAVRRPHAPVVEDADAALERVLLDPEKLLSPRELLRADVAEMV